MGYEFDNNVSKNGITKQDFEARLDKKLENLSSKKQAKYKEKAMDIFTKFASLNGDANVLDESEQIQFRAAFSDLDRNENGEISRKDIRKGKKGSETQKIISENGYKASKYFSETLDEAISQEASEDIGDVQYGEESNNGNSTVTVHYNQNSESTKDDGLKTYHIDDEKRVIRIDDIKENQTEIYEGEEDNPYDIDDEVDRTEADGLPPAPPEIKKSPNTKPKTKPTKEDIKSGFFQYITQDNAFTGKLKNGTTIDLPDGCKIVEDGIEYNGKIYKMRGDHSSSENPLRFECDETKETLQQAIAKSESTDNTHRYHNHGDNVNEQSKYDAKTGTITHGNDETAVSQTQTFASMLMNNAENSTLTLDKQSGKTITTGEIILNTINANEDNGIDMQELISYLNAAKNEANSVKNKTGARKFASGVDIDAKDLVNIGKVFKKYAGSDGKLQKEELQKLLDDLKKSSMTKLATGNDKYIGEKDSKPILENNPPQPIPKPEPEPKPDPEQVVIKDGNRERKVKDNNNTIGNGENQEYYYKAGKRTALKETEVDSPIRNNKIKVQTEDTDGNIAQNGRSSLFKKKFIYIQDLEKEINAKVLERTVNDQENQQIVRVKDKNDEITRYQVITNPDGSYTLGEELITKTTKGKNTYVTKSQHEKDIKKALGIPEELELPKNITAEYENGNMQIKLNGGNCSINTAKVYVIRHNTQLKHKVDDNVRQIDINPEIKEEKVKKSDDDNETYQKPIKLDKEELKIAEEQAKKQGLRRTNGSNFGWFYSNKKQTHYFWDKEKQKFIKYKNILYAHENGSVNFIEISNTIIQLAQNGNKNILNSIHESSTINNSNRTSRNITNVINGINQGKQKQKYFELMYNANPENIKSDISKLIILARYASLENDTNYQELYKFKQKYVDTNKYKNLTNSELKELDNITNELNKKILETKIKEIDKTELETIKAKAKEQGLTETWSSNYGWFKDKNENHYYWDKSQNKFINDIKISMIFFNGEVSL